MQSKLLFTSLLFVSIHALAQPAPQDHPATAPPAKKAAAIHAQQSEGERVFQQNCARCHNAPEGFSSRISGTIVRHMRVSAALSQHDEEALLHFLNP